MKSYGVKGVMVKLTEATSYRNPYAASQIANAKAAGMRIGGYHYSWYANPAQARIEGQYFAQFAKELGLSKNTPMADDLEEPSMISVNSNGRVNANVAAFRSGVASMGYTNNVLYTYASYSTQTNLNQDAYGKRKIWMASYPFTPSKQYLWHTDLGMWQFNSNMHFPNVRGTFDANIDYTGVMTPAKPKPVKKVNPTTLKKQMKFNQKNRTDGLYAQAPYGYGGAKFVGRPKHDAIVNIEKQEKASNGVIWYYGKVNGQYAWFDAKSVVNVPKKRVVIKTAVSNQVTRRDGLFVNAPYGQKNAQFVGRMPHNVKIEVEKQQTTASKVVWYYGKVNGKYVWFDATAVAGPVKLNTQNVNKTYVSRQLGRKDGMYMYTPFGYRDAKYAGRMPNDVNVRVEKKLTAANKVVWYYGKVNGTYVWFDSKAVVTPTNLKTTPVNKTYVTSQFGRKDGMYLYTPFGYSDAYYAGRMPNNVSVRVEKQLTAANKVVWYYGKVNGQYAWFDSKAVVAPSNLKTTPVNKTYVTNQAGRKDGMYVNAPFRYRDAKYAGRVPNNRAILVEKKFTDAKKVVWYYGKVNGYYVWVDSRSMKAQAVAPVKKAAPKKVVKKAPAKKTAGVLDLEKVNAQQLDADFVFNQTKRHDDLYKFSPRGEAGSEKLRKAVDGEVVHVIGQFVAEDDTIWYNTEINGESVWFEAKAGRLEV